MYMDTEFLVTYDIFNNLQKYAYIPLSTFRKKSLLLYHLEVLTLIYSLEFYTGIIVRNFITGVIYLY